MNSRSREVVIETWQPRLPWGAISRAVRVRPLSARLAVGVTVVAVHVLLFSWQPALVVRDTSGREIEASRLMVELIDGSPGAAPLEAPSTSAVLEPIPVGLPALREPGPVAADLESGESAQEPRPAPPFSAPRIDPGGEKIDSNPFAARAGIEPGRSATTLLALDISALGVVTNVIVEKSSGNPRADAEAAEYARALRWLPGIVNGEPRAMRVRFPAMLTRLM